MNTCQFCSQYITTDHHIIKREFGGCTNPNIILPLCESCATGLHRELMGGLRALIHGQSPPCSVLVGNKELELKTGSVFIDSPYTEPFKTPLYGVEFYNKASRSKENFEVSLFANSTSTLCTIAGSPSSWVYTVYALEPVHSQI